jgi:hypothetical protein
MLLHVYPRIHACFLLYVAAGVDTIRSFSMMHTHLHLKKLCSIHCSLTPVSSTRFPCSLVSSDMKQEVAHIDMFEIFTKKECKSIQKPARYVAQRGYCASQASIVTVTTSRAAEVVLLVTGVVMLELCGCRKMPPEAEGAEVVAAGAEVFDGACAAGDEVVATGSGWGLYVVGAGS